MEPRGCNRWQSAANRLGLEAAKTSEIRCHRLPPDGKEGVDGSSPSEGFREVPANQPLPPAPVATRLGLDVHQASTARRETLL
jgi:hypothetical protein